MTTIDEDKENAKYQIKKLYEQFKLFDSQNQKYGYEITDTTVLGNTMIDSIGNPRLCGAEQFKASANQLLNDDRVIKIKIDLYAGTSAKASHKGSLYLYETQIPKGISKIETPQHKSEQTNSDEQIEKVVSIITERLGISGIQAQETSLSGLGKLEVEYAKKQSMFDLQLAQITHKNEMQRLEDKIERKDEKIQSLEEKLADLKKEKESLEKNNDELEDELAQANEIIKKSAPAKFAERIAMGAGAKALMSFADKNPKVKEAIGAIVDSFDGEVPESSSSDTQVTDTPPVVQMEGLEQVAVEPTPIKEDTPKSKIEKYIANISNVLQHLTGSQLRMFDDVFKYFLKNPTDIHAYVKDKTEETNQSE